MYRVEEELVAGCGVGEQRHRGAELHIVGAAEDLVQRSPLNVNCELSAESQPVTEDGVVQIGLGFRFRRDRIMLGDRATTETRDLREDEPHPVTLFAPAAQLRANLFEDWILSLDEALQVEGIAHVFLSLAG
ncbi:MAG TPA: hypothetical protein VMD98_07235, partial [Bryocella sp.]|nr:hypothetical protein [Bryocella sp.]